MRIEISIVDDDGTRRVIACNQQIVIDGQNDRRPRILDQRQNPEVIRSLTTTEQWATSSVLLHTACKWLMVEPSHEPCLAAVAAYRAAERELQRVEHAAEANQIQRELLEYHRNAQRPRGEKRD